MRSMMKAIKHLLNVYYMPHPLQVVHYSHNSLGMYYFHYFIHRESVNWDAEHLLTYLYNKSDTDLHTKLCDS